MYCKPATLAAIAVVISSGFAFRGDIEPEYLPVLPHSPVSCSQQFQLIRQDFWGGTGSRGRYVEGRDTVTGWALFDTGATYLRIMPPVSYQGSNDDATSRPTALTFGNWSATYPGRYSPFLRGVFGPGSTPATSMRGTQIATVGSTVMKEWAVRFTDGSIFFSTDSAACSPSELRSLGFHFMSSRGYYQREGQSANVRAAVPQLLVIPTVAAVILGDTVPVQFDTGFQVADLQVQINDSLFARLKQQLGPKVDSVKINGTWRAVYQPGGASIGFVDTDSAQVFATVHNIRIVHKPSTDGGIANWGIPAAMISGRVFVAAFAETEFRADHKGVWGRARN